MSQKLVNIAGWQAVLDTQNSHYPVFNYLLRYRIKRKLANNIIISGEAGISKSYQAMEIAMLLQKDFDVERQVVFTFSEFMEAVMTLKLGVPIVFDEPSYAMSKRDWYKEINKALVATIESFRFKVHPLLIPIIHADLLDKTIREYLIQFKVVVWDRGKARVYRNLVDQLSGVTYTPYLCDLQYKMLALNQCDKESCLRCKRLGECQVWRARYERKKASLQEQRYEQSREDAISRESKAYSMKELELLALEIRDKIMTPEKTRIDIHLLTIAMEDNHSVKLPYYKAWNLRRRLEEHHPELFKPS